MSINITSPAKQKLENLRSRTRFSQGEIIDRAITNTPMPAVVAKDDQQYVELNEQLSHINQSLGDLGENSDQITDLILQGIRTNQLPDDPKYHEIIQRLQDIEPALDEVNQRFKHIQHANLNFLYNHRRYSGQ